MKALVTGGAGFIGSHLVEELLKNGLEVSIFDNFSSGNPHNLISVKSDIEVVKDDINNLDTLLKAMNKVDYVFHLAALTSVTQSVQNPILIHKINSVGTLNVLWSALTSKVSRVVIASSCAVYGDAHKPPIKETCFPLPKSPYATSKLISEAHASSFYESYGLKASCLRFFNVYGPRQRADSDYAAAIPRFIECYKNDKAPVVYGDGLQSRDFIHVKDIAKACILAAKSEKSLEGTRAFNVGTGESINILKLLDTMAEQSGKIIEPNFQPARQGDIKDSCSDTSLIKEKLGFEPSIKLENGIKELLN